MQLWYYFWNNFKKAGFTQWKLVKPLYESQVVKWKKSPNSFIKEQTESVMETERAKTDAQIDLITKEIKNSEESIQTIQNTRDLEKRKLKDDYSEKISALTNEKKRVESCFATYTTWLAEKAKSTEELFSKLTEKLWEYAEETKEYIGKQSTKAKGSLDVILDNTKGFLLDDIKRDFLAYKAQDTEKTSTPVLKSWIYSIILILLCSFDIVAWYISLNQENMWQHWLNLFIAILLVAIWMVLVYFSWTEMKKKWALNQIIGLCCIILVIFIFAVYTALALELGTREAIVDNIISPQGKINDIIKIFMNDTHLTFFILRLLILPALFVWDILIKMIDIDAIVSSLHLWNWVSKLIDRWIFFFRKRAFAKCVEEEKEHYWEILEWLKKFPIPGSEEILFQIEKLESKVMPISNELITKRNECEANIKDIDGKIKDLLGEEAVKLDNIDKSYVAILAKEEVNIAKRNAIINALNEQLWKAEISVREGIGLWLTD